MRERMKARYQCYRQGKEAYNDIAYVSVGENVSKILKDEDEECLIRENVRLIRDREPNLIREKNELLRENITSEKLDRGDVNVFRERDAHQLIKREDELRSDEGNLFKKK